MTTERDAYLAFVGILEAHVAMTDRVLTVCEQAIASGDAADRARSIIAAFRVYGQTQVANVQRMRAVFQARTTDRWH